MAEYILKGKPDETTLYPAFFKWVTFKDYYLSTTDWFGYGV